MPYEIGHGKPSARCEDNCIVDQQKFDTKAGCRVKGVVSVKDSNHAVQEQTNFSGMSALARASPLSDT
jgi:hypothetical protein